MWWGVGDFASVGLMPSVSAIALHTKGALLEPAHPKTNVLMPSVSLLLRALVGVCEFGMTTTPRCCVFEPAHPAKDARLSYPTPTPTRFV